MLKLGRNAKKRENFCFIPEYKAKSWECLSLTKMQFHDIATSKIDIGLGSVSCANWYTCILRRFLADCFSSLNITSFSSSFSFCSLIPHLIWLLPAHFIGFMILVESCQLLEWGNTKCSYVLIFVFSLFVDQ